MICEVLVMPVVDAHPKHTLYYSERGLPLMATQTSDKPILCVENYCKWYDLHLLHPNGQVTAVTSEITVVGFDHGWRVDHNFHPKLLGFLAHQNDWIVCSQSEELVAGRWSIEIAETISGWMEDYDGVKTN